MNEELQSSNEELETSKEELQSVNEELETVNAELSNKVEELGHTNADLANFLESTQIATLFLDREARVRRFTPVAREIFHLIDTDIGRPISDIATRIADTDMAAEVQRVLDRLVPVEREVRVRNADRIFLMRLLPYRSPDDVIEGVVVTFVDVSAQKEAQAQIAQLNNQLSAQVADLSALLELAPIGIAFADDPECKLISLNPFGARITGLSDRTAAPGSPGDGYTIWRDGREVPTEELPLQTAWRTGKPVYDFQATFAGEGGLRFEMLMSAAPVFDEDGKVRRVIGIINDITQLVMAKAEADLRAEQHAYVAQLGRISLRGAEADALIAEIPNRLAELLDVDLAKVLLCRPGSSDLELAAQHGFSAPLGTLVEGGSHSHAGLTLANRDPVIVEDLRSDTRFSEPALLKSEGVVSGMSVIVGDADAPLGTVAVHTRARRTFTDDDVAFLQSVANVLGATLRRDAADRQKKLLLDELRHRVKNMLATVQSVTSLTLRQTGADSTILHRVSDRLQALSMAHDLNFHRDDDRVDVRELVLIQCRPYDPEQKRITVEGSGTVNLPPGTAIDVSMIVHELVTNAVKHGALSVEDGSVTIRIAATKREGREILRLHWKERSSAPRGEITRKGSGTRLLDALASQHHLELERGFDDDGFWCRLDVTT